MRTIAHLSDLHFGRIDPPVAEGLVADLQLHFPDLLVVSGDFTQRARRRQYAQAAAFLKRLPTPQLLVPGNHDIPLYDVFRRFLSPLGRYRRFITDEMLPEYRDTELMVLGIRTARSFTRTSGWITPDQLDHLRIRFGAAGAGVFKVLVTHHPFVPPPGRHDADVLINGAAALAQLEDSGVDLLLAGHLHLAYHDDVRSHHVSARRSVLSIQAGTAASTRLRGEPNAYNWITLGTGQVIVAVRTWNGSQFEQSRVTRYERVDHQWRAAQPLPADPSVEPALRSPVRKPGPA